MIGKSIFSYVEPSDHSKFAQLFSANHKNEMVSPSSSSSTTNANKSQSTSSHANQAHFDPFQCEMLTNQADKSKFACSNECKFI